MALIINRHMQHSMAFYLYLFLDLILVVNFLTRGDGWKHHAHLFPFLGLTETLAK